MKPTLVPHLAVDRADHAHAHGINRADVIVLHSTESHDHPGTSDVEGILTFLEGKDYGVHYCVDGEGNIGRGAYHHQLVYHCQGANSFSVGIEMIGRAAWPMKRWSFDTETRKARKQLAAVAKLIAFISREERIPLVLSTSHGVACHSDFPEGGHWDPGPSFPLRWVMKRARLYRRIYKAAPRRVRIGA